MSVGNYAKFWGVSWEVLIYLFWDMKFLVSSLVDTNRQVGRNPVK